MKKILLAALWLPLMALAQSYPSPTYQNVTVLGTLTGKVNSTGSTITNPTITGATITGGTISGLTSPLPVASGGTNSATASGTALDNITGFASTGFLTRTGSGTYAFQSLTNGITLGNLATQAANTVLANATASTAGPTAFSMPGCSAATSALQWTSGAGFACNTSITASAVAANSVTNSGLAQAAAYTEKCNPNSTTGNVTDCNRPNLNVEDFGVKGDNSTDNSTNMANAVSACIALGGCNLHFSTKTGVNFLMHGVLIAANGVNITCESGVDLINNSTNTYAIQFGNGATQYNSQSMSNCRFGQATGVTPTTGNVGLSLNYVLGFHMHDVTTGPFPAALEQGVSVLTSTFVFIDGLQATGALVDGVVLNGGNPALGGGDLYLTNSLADSNGQDGWNITDYQGIYASNVTAYGNGRYAWNLFKTTYGNKNLFFNNVIGDTSGDTNWQITSLNNGVFTNAWGSTQSSTTVNTAAKGFLFAGSGVTDIQMISPTAINNNSHGIAILNSGGMPQNITITNPIAGSSSTGNGKAASGGYGIWVDNAATKVTVIGGEALNNTTGAIFQSGTAATLSTTKVQGYNPRGFIAAPVIPASGTPVTNTTGSDCMVYVVGGSVSNISVAGSQVLVATPGSVLVPSGSTITLTYSSAPTWTWSGL